MMVINLVLIPHNPPCKNTPLHQQQQQQHHFQYHFISFRFSTQSITRLFSSSLRRWINERWEYWSTTATSSLTQFFLFCLFFSLQYIKYKINILFVHSRERNRTRSVWERGYMKYMKYTPAIAQSAANFSHFRRLLPIFRVSTQKRKSTFAFFIEQ